jgi:ABC-type bacteriocin/lantibiotic exporter with double-glycine peptidase domain
MRRKIQRDVTGCGLACVSMLAGVTYASVKSRAIALGLVESRGPFYTCSADLRKLLLSFDLTSKQGRKVTSWQSVSTLAIVAINHQAASDTWHWVVYISSGNDAYVLDPRAKIKTARRVDFGRMHLRSFIPIDGPNSSSKRTREKPSAA